MNKKILVYLAIFIFVFVSNKVVSAQKTPPKTRIKTIRGSVVAAATSEPANLNAEQKRRLEAFNQVWQTIDRYYFDKTFSGLNWNTIKNEYQPRVLKTTTDAQLHSLLQEMINRLNRSHFAIIPPEVYTTIKKAKEEFKEKERKLADKNKNNLPEDETDESEEDEEFKIEDFLPSRYGLGVDLRLIDDKTVITRVEKDSAGEYAGLKTGYIIEKINDVALEDLFRRIALYSTDARNYRKHLPLQIVNWFLNGDDERYVALTVRDEKDQLREFKIKRERMSGETISLGKNFPAQHFRFETESLNDEVGYIRFNLFALPVIEKFCDSLTKFKDKKAVIVDLRGNLGGVIGTLIGLGGMLTESEIDLGTSIYNVGSERLIAKSKAKNYKGKLVFLVDSQTVSAAEVFSAAVQENDRAIVIGERTAGEALPAVSIELATGAYLIYPIANYKTVKGTFLEGKGVEPNITVSLDRKTLLSGKDNQLETALQLIKENKVLPKKNETLGIISAPTPVLSDTINRNSPPPPPPPPAPKPTPKTLASVQVKIPPPPPPAAKPETETKDEKSLLVFADFAKAIGGSEAFGKIQNYSLKGNATLGIKGSKSEFTYSIYRERPNRLVEILTSDIIGEVRSLYDGKTATVQTAFGSSSEIPFTEKVDKVDIFQFLYNVLDQNGFRSLKYQGIFDRLGRKTHILEGKTSEGFTIALGFDVETKFLVSYVGTYFGMSFGDYRKVDNLMLPFYIEREGMMEVLVEDIKINTKMDESIFMKKEKCFDRAN
ncbi:MAG TPA: S41 family peptidase [Pyrinomonadaceae bacterium]|nr:S41 family peptidase [Pyrinomonadaceae bacterium]